MAEGKLHTKAGFPDMTSAEIYAENIRVDLHKIFARGS